MRLLSFAIFLPLTSALLRRACRDEPSCAGSGLFARRWMCCRNQNNRCLWLTSLAEVMGCDCGKCPDDGIQEDGESGECCKYTGPIPANCTFYENLPTGADLDGRCSQVNQGMSCSWDYTDPGKSFASISNSNELFLDRNESCCSDIEIP